MAVEQYLRKASLLVGLDGGEAFDLSSLRFRFAVRRGDLQTPNSADIRIYNVADQTALKIDREFTRVVLQAGYEGNYGIIFDGTIKQVRRGRESPTDTYLDITAADGDSAYNFSTMAMSLAGGSKPADHVQAVLENMTASGIGKGYIPELPANALPRGKVFYGMARDEMRKVARNTNTSWSIQDGKLQLVPESAYMPGEVPVITAATGMIGLPEQTPNGIRVKTLLNPNVKIGSLVKLDNKSIQQYRYNLSVNQSANNLMTKSVIKTDADGYYYVMVADHSGDNRGNEWYSHLICLAVDATIPLSYINKTGVGPVGPVKPYG